MRQAVVIIHGIGEQKPMSTLRGFVDSLVKHEAVEKIKNGEIEAYKKNYWSKPDKMSESFELRKLVLEGKRERPTTDFFEYYWAFNMQGTSMGHIIPWFKTLLFKWPWKVPGRLFFVWLLSWILTLGIATGFLLFFSSTEESPFGDGIKGKIISFTGTAILIWLQRTLIGSIGDAARYLTPDPANISERHNIRKNGIELLRKLHEPDENGKQKYGRIILVGHSLGTVIAYDMITHLWPQYNTIYEAWEIDKKESMEEIKMAADNLKKAIKEKKDETEINNLETILEEKQLALGKVIYKTGENFKKELVEDVKTAADNLKKAIKEQKDETEINNLKTILEEKQLTLGTATYESGKFVKTEFMEEVKTAADNLENGIKENKTESEIINLKTIFQEKQKALGNAMREAGNPWLVTDFITMGSPLAHGAFLLSSNEQDFDDRKEDRELLACPPVLEEKTNGYYYFNLDERRYYLHHAAAFAPTVWTNIYFPGDIIGGPVSGVFGHGVKDIKVFYKGFFNKLICHFSPLTHIAYWRDKADLNKMEKYKTREAIKQLFDAVDLNRD